MNNSKHGSSPHVNKITEWIGVAAVKTCSAAIRFDICSTERFGVVSAVLHLKCAYCCCKCQHSATLSMESLLTVPMKHLHTTTAKEEEEKTEWRKKSFSCKTKMACTCTSWNRIIGRSIFEEIFVKNSILNHNKSILCDPYGVKSHTNFCCKPIVLVLFDFGVPQMSWFFISQTGERKKSISTICWIFRYFLIEKQITNVYNTLERERKSA